MYFCKTEFGNTLSMNKHNVSVISHNQMVEYGIIQRVLAVCSRFLQALPAFLLLLAVTPIDAQRIAYNGMETVHYDHLSIDFDFNVDDLSLLPQDDSYILLTSPATNSFSRETGKPQLPLYQKIVIVPKGVRPTVYVIDEEWETRTISTGKLLPAAGARTKETEWSVPTANPDIYSSDSSYGFPLVTLTPLGTMRDYDVMRLTIAPFRYNPFRNTVYVCRHISASLSIPDTYRQKSLFPINRHTISRMGVFDYLALGFAGETESKDYVNGMGNGEVLHLEIVAPSRFRNTLRPLISWKRQEGYIVEELYIDNADNSQIKGLLQQRYDSADDDNPAPLYILFVGDAADIPIWPARQHIQGIDLHSTDMPYVEFTGDSLPDALFGRISTSDTTELSWIISKTLSYEKALFDDTTFLHRSLIVAGTEWRNPAPTVTNGQVNYLKEQLLRIDPLHDTICYHNPGSDTLVDEIFEHLQQGNAMVNYTAHCMASGWRNPTIPTIMVDTLPEDGKPFLSINNCCRANAFSGDCFGEHLLRKQNGGAIGVIGATNETLWDEDYYWSVGNREALDQQPQYQTDACGAFDRLFHTHNENHEQWAMTQSQIVAAGNWAVTRSGSPYWAFYWEIYCLLGDPTLMPFVGVPADGSLDISPLQRGDITVTLHGTPYARVAATCADTLLGLCMLDSDGNGIMECTTPLTGNILFTSTAQYHRPVQQLVALGHQSIETTSDPKIEIYPNPTKWHFTISGLNHPATISIYDLNGRLVKTYSHCQGPVQCTIGDLSSGIYHIIIECEDRITVHKLAVEH